MAQTTFLCYQSLLLALKRAQVKEPGITATLLLETFLANIPLQLEGACLMI